MTGLVALWANVDGERFQIVGDSLAIGFGLLFVLDLLATMIHEAGHALAIRHANRRVLDGRVPALPGPPRVLHRQRRHPDVAHPRPDPQRLVRPLPQPGRRRNGVDPRVPDARHQSGRHAVPAVDPHLPHLAAEPDPVPGARRVLDHGRRPRDAGSPTAVAVVPAARAAEQDPATETALAAGARTHRLRRRRRSVHPHRAVDVLFHLVPGVRDLREGDVAPWARHPDPRRRALRVHPRAARRGRLQVVAKRVGGRSGTCSGGSGSRPSWAGGARPAS